MYIPSAYVTYNMYEMYKCVNMFFYNSFISRASVIEESDNKYSMYVPTYILSV